MDHEAFQRWLDAYVEAWRSYDPALIGALFSDDASYRYHPQDDPITGRQAIVASWLEEPDEQGTYDARYEPLAIDAEIHVAHGVTRYFSADGQPTDEYANVYVCRFDGDGRCTDFVEYWIQAREFRRRDRLELLRQAGSG